MDAAVKPRHVVDKLNLMPLHLALGVLLFFIKTPYYLNSILFCAWRYCTFFGAKRKKTVGKYIPRQKGNWLQNFFRHNTINGTAKGAVKSDC